MISIKNVVTENLYETIHEYVKSNEMVVDTYESMVDVILSMIKGGYCFSMDRDILRDAMESLTYMYAPSDDMNKDRLIQQFVEEDEEDDEDSDEGGDEEFGNMDLMKMMQMMGGMGGMSGTSEGNSEPTDDKDDKDEPTDDKDEPTDDTSEIKDEASSECPLNKEDCNPEECTLEECKKVITDEVPTEVVEETTVVKEAE